MFAASSHVANGLAKRRKAEVSHVLAKRPPTKFRRFPSAKRERQYVTQLSFIALTSTSSKRQLFHRKNRCMAGTSPQPQSRPPLSCPSIRLLCRVQHAMPSCSRSLHTVTIISYVLLLHIAVLSHIDEFYGRWDAVPTGSDEPMQAGAGGRREPTNCHRHFFTSDNFHSPKSK